MNMVKGAGSMLTNSAPPNTPPEYIDELKETNFLRSKKFFIVFSSFLIILAYFGVGTFILFLTSPLPDIIAPFVTIFTKTLEVLVIIVSVYLGLQATLDFKYGSNSNVNYSGENKVTTEKVEQVIVHKYAEKYKNDPSYAPIDWALKDDK